MPERSLRLRWNWRWRRRASRSCLAVYRKLLRSSSDVFHSVGDYPSGEAARDHQLYRVGDSGQDAQAVADDQYHPRTRRPVILKLD
jgi:hypothetical protein